MILRNLAEALREQNWFTVVLEVLIVVVGILTAKQKNRLLPFDDSAQFTVGEALQALERMRVKPDFVVQIPLASGHAFAIETYESWLDAAQILRDRIEVDLGYR